MKIILTVSDIIDLFGIIASLIISIVAITISVKDLRQNTKMIEESTRPYLQIYSQRLNSIVYIIIKNFGQSSCVLDSVKCSHEFIRNESPVDFGKDIFEKISGAIMTPGFSIRYPILGSQIPKEDLTFDILYHSSCKKYEEHFCFNLLANAPFSEVTPSGSNVDAYIKNISNTLNSLTKLKL